VQMGVGGAAEGATLATTSTGVLEIDAGAATGSPAAQPAIYTTKSSDATVGAVISDINSSGTGLVASLNSTGNLVVTDTQNRGVSSTTALTANATNSTLKLTVGGTQDASAEVGANTINASTFDVYLSDGTTAGSSSIDTTLTQLSSSNMNGVSLGGNDLLSSTDSQSALTQINSAIAQVAALRGTLGASMNRLTAAGNVINDQTQNLTSAEGNVSSADISQQVTQMSQDQVLTQTGISALAQANQMQQALLKLLQ